jgi:CheY-like chemotaxis protein
MTSCSPEAWASTGDPSPVTLTVLVVDDNALVAACLVRMLARAGHRVVVCASYAEGLAMSQREPIDVALVDLHLPDRSGRDLMQALSVTQPSIRSILVSGDPGGADERTILKPFTAPALLRAVEEPGFFS